jgi:hypothetical protein
MPSNSKKNRPSGILMHGVILLRSVLIVLSFFFDLQPGVLLSTIFRGERRDSVEAIWMAKKGCKSFKLNTKREGPTMG